MNDIPDITLFADHDLKNVLSLCKKGDEVLEIGTAFGRSATAWKDAGATVYTIDLHAECLKYIKDITFIKGNSLLVPWDKRVDIVYIDGDHSYEGCLKDIRRFMPFAKRIICGHDYAPGFPEVMRAVDDFFGDLIEVKNNWWIVRKDG
jgi:hypothetical protein